MLDEKLSFNDHMWIIYFSLFSMIRLGIDDSGLLTFQHSKIWYGLKDIWLW